jgi:hypothetical protein
VLIAAERPGVVGRTQVADDLIFTVQWESHRR